MDGRGQEHPTKWVKMLLGICMVPRKYGIMDAHSFISFGPFYSDALSPIHYTINAFSKKFDKLVMWNSSGHGAIQWNFDLTYIFPFRKFKYFNTTLYNL
jgi:hypothetical protein